MGWERFIDWGDGLDPVGEFDSMEWGIYSNLLVRTLVGYQHVAGAGGREVVADLATTVPSPTNGGTTYTFTLKRGVRFGPPVNREITSRDIRYALERHVRGDSGPQFRFYFDVVRGVDHARRADDRLQPQTARRRLPAPSDPPRGGARSHARSVAARRESPTATS